jgi:hypothetical protein
MRAKEKSRVPGTLGLALVLFLISGSFVQEPGQPSSARSTIRVQSSLVLVDVISQDAKNALPVRDFRKEDFRMSDNGNEVPITSFDSGAHCSTRPFILWLAVICNEGGKIGGSKDFVSKERLFRPALDHLDQHDSVGVAHRCDDGETRLDLLPTEDRDSPLRVLAETIKPIPFQVSGNSNLVGEDTYRKMLRLMQTVSRQRFHITWLNRQADSSLPPLKILMLRRST